MNKEQRAIALIQKTEPLALKLNPEGFHVAFSGGKDSQVILELVKRAGVKYQVFFYKTSVDPPELLSFMRDNYPEVIVLKPGMTMYQLIIKKGFLPTRTIRFCCEYLKEKRGLDSIVITGIRAKESNKRAKRKEFEMSCKNGHDKGLLAPIFYWSDSDVWQFLRSNNIETCSLYNHFSRIGCVGCPMNPKTQRAEFIRYPQFKKMYLNALVKLRENGKMMHFDSPEEQFEWWISGVSQKKFKARKLQYKLEL